MSRVRKLPSIVLYQSYDYLKLVSAVVIFVKGVIPVIILLLAESAPLYGRNTCNRGGRGTFGQS